jgi:adenosylcobinamide-GDP ribazoletransferase
MAAMSVPQEGQAPTRGRGELRAATAAVAFLTRIPVGRWVDLDGADVARAGPAFPLVGAGIGAVVGGIAAALAGPLSAPLAVALALSAGALLTGALHLDALADTADALGAPSRERALEIMRDSVVGAYGAVAIVLDLLIKAAALAALADDGHALTFAVAAGALSRSIPVGLAAALPNARPGESVATSLTGAVRGRAVAAAIVAFAVAALVAGLDGLLAAASAAVLAVLMGLGFRRWLGGVTGDALGAGVELGEAAVLVVGVALLGAG